MNLVKTLCFAPAVVLAMTTSALAQAIEPGLPPRHTLSGIGGAALNADFQEPTTALAVEYGERLHRNVVAFANLSYIQNLMSDQMRQNLVSAGEILTAGTGQLWEFRGHDRGLAFTAGAKYLFPTGSALRPYVGGGFGVLNLNRTIRERDLGDVTGEFFLLTSLPGDGIIAATETYTTDPLAEAIAGVSGAFGRTFLDVSYRYRWGFHEYGPIEFSQLTIGVGVAWH